MIDVWPSFQTSTNLSLGVPNTLSKYCWSAELTLMGKECLIYPSYLTVSYLHQNTAVKQRAHRNVKDKVERLKESESETQ